MKSLNINQKQLSSNILLSIITVSRNDFRRLNLTLKSLTRFYDDHRFEHIVIDGNSTDKTQVLLEKYSHHENFKYLSESDCGIYDAMNKGTHLATGCYLLFLNCGDQILALPDQIHSWLDGLLTGNRADIICFSSLAIRDNKIIMLRPQLTWPYRMPTSHQAMVFSKEFIRHHFYDTRYMIAADFNLYLKADKKRVIFFNTIEAFTAIEAIGVASQNPLQSYKEYLHIVTHNLRGGIKYMALIRIGLRAITVILLKKTLPGKWALVFRRNM